MDLKATIEATLKDPFRWGYVMAAFERRDAEGIGAAVRRFAEDAARDIEQILAPRFLEVEELGEVDAAWERAQEALRAAWGEADTVVAKL